MNTATDRDGKVVNVARLLASYGNPVCCIIGSDERDVEDYLEEPARSGFYIQLGPHAGTVLQFREDPDTLAAIWEPYEQL